MSDPNDLADEIHQNAELLVDEIWELRGQNKLLLEEVKRLQETMKRAWSGIGPGRPNRPKLSWQDAQDIRNAYNAGEKQKDLAAKYGVNSATISRIIRGVYY
ncbi:HTH DNA binding protein [Mycobacterium phage Phlei]|uniref:Uncharacterized protein n=1 Tax=Mycobacterium phage Phlei TaxID=1690684 RepID=A0A0N7E4I0_9CAUD|nr:HTH DNA binding protein [Mycobacterium phage Phlei]ALA48149.1 hypothetical protein [Mycobacterium phage Phlei]